MANVHTPCKDRAAKWREKELWKSELALRAYNKPGIPYKEAVALLVDTLDQLKYLPVFDIAHRTFSKLATNYRHICDALAVQSGHELKDHLEPINVIWSYADGAVTEEKVIYIPLGRNTDYYRHIELKAAASLELLRMGYGPETVNSLEIVVA